jgi:hypothetical protein
MNKSCTYIYPTNRVRLCDDFKVMPTRVMINKYYYGLAQQIKYSGHHFIRVSRRYQMQIWSKARIANSTTVFLIVQMIETTISMCSMKWPIGVRRHLLCVGDYI